MEELRKKRSSSGSRDLGWHQQGVAETPRVFWCGCSMQLGYLSSWELGKLEGLAGERLDEEIRRKE